jgi:hypothetical protein
MVTFSFFKINVKIVLLVVKKLLYMELHVQETKIAFELYQVTLVRISETIRE